MKKVLKVLAGLLALVVIISMIAYFTTTPAQKAQWAKERATKDSLDLIAKNGKDKEPEIYSSIQGFIDSANVVNADETKIISAKPLIVSISTVVVEGEEPKGYHHILCKDIIWFVYNVFANTNVDSLEVICTPYKSKLDQKPGKKINSESLHLKTNRNVATEVMNLKIGTSNFKDLLYKKDGIYLPSEKFEELKSLNNEFVVSVFDALVDYQAGK